eukprot:scaffold106519_cov124-Phaeocystis_antarctica.AAC.1
MPPVWATSTVDPPRSGANGTVCPLTSVSSCPSRAGSFANARRTLVTPGQPAQGFSPSVACLGALIRVMRHLSKSATAAWCASVSLRALFLRAAPSAAHAAFLATDAFEA